MYCIAAATGEMRWTHEMGLTQTGAVACDASGDVVTALWDQGLLTALDLQTGKPLWEADLLPQKTRYGLHPAVIHAELAFAWDRANVLHAFSLADGSEAWSWDLADVVEDDRRLTDAMPSSPAVIGGRLLVPVGGTGKVMAALDPVTGELFWSREWSFSHSWPVWLPMLPLSGDRFISRTAERLVCAATADGSPQWSLPAERIFGLVGAGDLLVLALSDGVVVIDAKLHQVVARFPGIGASQGLQAEQRDGVLRIIAAGPDRIEAWEIALH